MRDAVMRVESEGVRKVSAFRGGPRTDNFRCRT